MKPQFAHYWQEGVILNKEERERKKKITQAMNQGFVYTVLEGSPDKWARFNCTQQYELQEMMLREHDPPSHLMSFFLDDVGESETDGELTQRLCEREPSESEPVVFLTQADYDAAISWVFFYNT